MTTSQEREKPDMAQKRALAAVKALGDGISPAAAAAYALGFTAGAVSSHLDIIC